jgi:hypothetical protein
MSNFTISFDRFDHSFCEAMLFNNGPEYISCLTALFISFIGFFGIIMNQSEDDTLFLYYSLIINGITSSLYHYNHYIGWGLMDRFSMILIAVYCFKIFFKVLEKNNTRISHIVKFMSVLYLVYIQTFAGLHQEDYFNNMFGFFLASILFFVIKISSLDYNIYPRLIELSFKGIFLIALGGASWIITENLCGSFGLMKYLMGHAIWHICVALGGYYISLVPIYLNYTHVLERPRIKYWHNIPYIE